MCILGTVLGLTDGLQKHLTVAFDLNALGMLFARASDYKGVKEAQTYGVETLGWTVGC